MSFYVTITLNMHRKQFPSRGLQVTHKIAQELQMFLNQDCQELGTRNKASELMWESALYIQSPISEPCSKADPRQQVPQSTNTHSSASAQRVCEHQIFTYSQTNRPDQTLTQH